ncbi:MAG: hypothetical protein A2289_15780 [Deltaproteobacteria bacterium RIFOXYA12_FULL_58_15]|nr:MAG: hypothetical protein A2289_15780 [Deltaproteobacteria bacterium RIFOXYA12_FULL_58_15]
MLSARRRSALKMVLLELAWEEEALRGRSMCAQTQQHSVRQARPRITSAEYSDKTRLAGGSQAMSPTRETKVSPVKMGSLMFAPMLCYVHLFCDVSLFTARTIG